MPRKSVQLQIVPHQRMQTVETLAHITSRQAHIDPYAGRQVDHLRSASSTVRNTVAFTLQPIRSRSPLGSTNSSVYSAPALRFSVPVSTSANRPVSCFGSRFRHT